MVEQEVRCSDALGKALDRCQSSIGKINEGTRLLTGTFFDKLAGGLKRGDLTVLVGKSNAGKSALVKNLVMSISTSEKEHVLLVPLQDASEETAIMRLAAIQGNIPLAIFDEQSMSKADRIDVFDAIDAIRAHNLDITFRDGMNLTPMLYERAMESFSEDLERRALFSKTSKVVGEDILPGSGAVFVDTMTLLSDVDDIREGVKGLKSLSCGSDVAVVAVANVGLEYLSDAGCVILVEADKRDEKRGVMDVQLTVVKDGTSAASGRCVKGVLDLATLKFSDTEEIGHVQ